MNLLRARDVAFRGALAAAALLAGNAMAVPSPVSTEAPIAYRCDHMQLTRQQHGGVCQGNVVLRQNDLLLCCQRLTGQADANGLWRSFVCEGDVRGVQHDAQVWAGRAHYDALRERLLLTRSPVAERGGSLLTGERITLHTRDDRLEVQKPRGRLSTRSAPPPEAGAAAPLPGDGLPPLCPLPPPPPCSLP